MDKSRMFQLIKHYTQGEIMLALAASLPGRSEAKQQELRASTDGILQHIVLELEKLES